MIRQEPLLIGSLLLGFLYNLLFYGKRVGISFPIFIGTIILMLLYMIKQTNGLKKDVHWLFAIPILLLSIRSFISDNGFFHFINHKIVMILFAAMSILLVSNEPYKLESFRFLSKIIETLLYPLKYFIKPYTFIYKSFKTEKKVQTNSQVKKVLLGLFISLPILVIITALLSSADMVFNELVSFLPSKLTSFLKNMDFFYYVGQLLLILFVATYSYAYGWNLFTKKPPLKQSTNEFSDQSTLENIENTSKRKRYFDGTVLVTVLLMINLVYLIFCIIQFTYLFSGGFNTLPGNFTYAEYARQGFFQLLLVTMLNFVFILLSVYFLEPTNKKMLPWVHGLLSLMVVLTYIMIYSSYYRMGLYSDNYGYTYLRIFVYFFLFTEVPLLGFTLVYIFKPRFNLIRVYIITVLVFYMGLNYVNIDKMIAKNNVDRYFETGKIDIYYLRGLSYDAVPQLNRLLEAEDPSVREKVENYLIRRAYEFNKQPSWQEFNYSRYKAGQVLEPWKAVDPKEWEERRQREIMKN